MSISTSVHVCVRSLALLLVVAALGAAWPALATAQQQSGSKPPFPSPYDKDALSPEYRIAPGDVLQVFVWREAELSREVRVRTDGYLTVPLLGDVFAVAKTPRELSTELAEQLGRFITAPTVTVTVGSSSSQRFFVVGEVGRPGEYPLISRTTVLQALALAGGFREFAKTDEIKIIRQEVLVGVDKRPFTREIVLPVSYKSLARGQDLQQNYVLKPSDVIVVP
ncbi:MAG: polysaccharide biosynthesis/export family protein [Acidobacteriota bacterium]|jgi:polysaccharide export outer membrane protein